MINVYNFIANHTSSAGSTLRRSGCIKSRIFKTVSQTSKSSPDFIVKKTSQWTEGILVLRQQLSKWFGRRRVQLSWRGQACPSRLDWWKIQFIRIFPKEIRFPCPRTTVTSTSMVADIEGKSKKRWNDENRCEEQTKDLKSWKSP